VTRTAHKTCNLCEAACGLLIDVEGDRVAAIRPDKEDPFSRGHICPKAFTLKEIHEDPDRLRRPLRRTARGWVEVGWDEALDEAATRLAALQRRDGRDAVATYVGNPVAHSFSTGLGVLAILQAVGSRSRFCTNSVDSNPKLCSSLLLFGSQVAIPVPDIDRTQHLLVLGANPIVSNGSIMTAPDVRGRLRAIQARGGRIVVVDPRRTETARIADEHVFIRPGEDALLLAALLQVVLAERLGRDSPAMRRAAGLDRLIQPINSLTPERVAPRLGIPAETIRRLAHEFAAAPSAACYGRTGTCNAEFGTLASWLIDVLNLVTGNLDRPGGAMFPTPAVDLGALAARIGQRGHLGRWRSRVRGLPEFNDELPVACLAEEILTPAGQSAAFDSASLRSGRAGEIAPSTPIRGLVTIAANPVLSAPNGGRLDEALAALEFFVAVDIYRNESTRHAHLILPPLWSLEQENYEALAYLVAVRNVAKYSPAVLPAPPGTRRDYDILVELSLRLIERRERGLKGAVAGAVRRTRAVPTPRRLLDLLLRTGPHGDRFLPWSRGLNLKKLEAQKKGIDLGPLEPSLDRVVAGASWRIPLDAPEMLAELARLAARADAAPADGIVLIGRRDVRTNNSWAHNAPLMVKGRPRCTLLMHPRDAARLGLADGQDVRVSSRVGAVVAPLEVSEEVMPGVVSLPHGWGHGRAGTALSIAATQPGVSANDLTDERALDPVVGNPVLNGVPVTVSAAVGGAAAAGQP
jgi:anaerobic selenocysteine-containing dehydrogenase